MLSQSDVWQLFSAPKRFLNSAPVSLNPGIKEVRDLESRDGGEPFLLDVWRGRRSGMRLTYQGRARAVCVIARLEIGSTHTNPPPDSRRIGGPHLHVYREGFDDRWAIPLNPTLFDQYQTAFEFYLGAPLDLRQFPHLSNVEDTFYDFCRFCNIADVPPTQGLLL